MRTFTDLDGTTWQAALLNASYGNVILVFSPLGGGANRQQLLPSENLAQAESYLANLSEDELRENLGDAAPWGNDLGIY